MNKISIKEFENDVEKTDCVDIRVCTKTRKCGWKGTYPELKWKRIDSIESVHVCPSCGNEEFYIEYMPISKYKDKYVV